MSKFVFVSTPSVLVKDDILGSWPVFSKDVVARSKGGFGRDCPCVSASVRINHALASSFHSPPHVFVALVPRAARLCRPRAAPRHSPVYSLPSSRHGGRSRHGGGAGLRDDARLGDHAGLGYGTGLGRDGAGLRRRGAGLHQDGTGLGRDGAVLRRRGAGLGRDGVGLRQRGAGLRRGDAGVSVCLP